MTNALIKAQKISKVYRLLAEEIHAVRSVDLVIHEGDFISIMGPSGSGKTTLLDILGCLTSTTSGTLEVLGRDVSRLEENALVVMRRRNIGFVFQDFLLIPTLTAVENVELPLLFDRLPADRAKTILLLEKVGLGHRLNHLPKQLSGGERQRVAIARAMVTQPKIIFADEPTGNLDSKSGEQIVDILQELNNQDGLTIVITTHNAKIGSRAGRVVYLKDGRIVSKDQSGLCPVEK